MRHKSCGEAFHSCYAATHAHLKWCFLGGFVQSFAGFETGLQATGSMGCAHSNGLVMFALILLELPSGTQAIPGPLWTFAWLAREHRGALGGVG